MLKAVEEALSTDAGHVVVEAVPGAGKTHLLVALAARRPSLVLAYNSQLAADVSQRLPEGSLCSTFHALCGRCIGLARDDFQLSESVAAAERGERTPENVPQVTQILVEVQRSVNGRLTLGKWAEAHYG